MARRTTWIPRLHEIQRSVKNSVRSHYERRDIEQLFGVQPSAARKLMTLFTGQKVGNGKLVSREELGEFLERAHQASDVGEMCRQMRSTAAPPSRRKLRTFQREEFDWVAVASLPESIALEPGRIELRFETLDQLALSLWMLATCLQSDAGVEDLARICEPERPEDLRKKAEREDALRIEQELREMMERIRGRAQADLAPGQVLGR